PAKATVRALANGGKAYAIYVNGGTQAEVVLELPAGQYEAEWIDTKTARAERTETFRHGGGTRALASPAYSHDIAFRIVRQDADAITDSAATYFPPPESQGGWRKLEKPEDIRRLGGMDPEKLTGLKQWLLDSDNRDFAAVVTRHGYIVLEVERGNSAKT